MNVSWVSKLSTIERDEHPVEREAADQQQRRDPQRRDADHAPGQRAGAPPGALLAAAVGRFGRRRHRGGLLVQLTGSSRSSRGRGWW